MSPYFADLFAALPGGRGTTRRRFTIRTSKKAIPREIDQLRRAFDRSAAHGDGATAVEVSVDRGCFLVAIETSASERRAVRECEDLFAVAWYDAFGQRSSPHMLWSSDQ